MLHENSYYVDNSFFFDVLGLSSVKSFIYPGSGSASLRSSFGLVSVNYSGTPYSTFTSSSFNFLTSYSVTDGCAILYYSGGSLFRAVATPIYSMTSSQLITGGAFSSNLSFDINAHMASNMFLLYTSGYTRYFMSSFNGQAYRYPFYVESTYAQSTDSVRAFTSVSVSKPNTVSSTTDDIFFFTSVPVTGTSKYVLASHTTDHTIAIYDYSTLATTAATGSLVHVVRYGISGSSRRDSKGLQYPYATAFVDGNTKVIVVSEVDSERLVLLKFDETTNTISYYASRTFTFTAVHGIKSTSTHLILSVEKYWYSNTVSTMIMLHADLLEVPEFQVSASSFSYIVGEVVSIPLTVNSSRIYDSFSIQLTSVSTGLAASLPSGLYFNTTSGALTGSTSIETPTLNITITAVNIFQEYSLSYLVVFACPDGYEQPSGVSSCTECNIGSYRTSADVGESCFLCSGSTTTVNYGSTSVSDCICQAGSYYENSTCVPCPVGSYKDVAGLEACTYVCPENSASTEGNFTSRNEALMSCFCDSGYYGNYLSGCSLCPIGYYCEGQQETPTSCENNTSTLTTGNVNITSCLCNVGYEWLASECVECGLSSTVIVNYKTTIGNTTCTEKCPTASYSLVTGGTSVKVCDQCNSGYYNATTSAGDCRACPVGSYCQGGVTSPISCPSTMTTFATGMSTMLTCHCKAGYGRQRLTRTNSDTGLDEEYLDCVVCTDTQYKPFIGNFTCANCSPGSSTGVEGALSVNECVCDVGYAYQYVSETEYPSYQYDYQNWQCFTGFNSGASYTSSSSMTLFQCMDYAITVDSPLKYLGIKWVPSSPSSSFPTFPESTASCDDCIPWVQLTNDAYANEGVCSYLVRSPVFTSKNFAAVSTSNIGDSYAGYTACTYIEAPRLKCLPCPENSYCPGGRSASTLTEVSVTDVYNSHVNFTKCADNAIVEAAVPSVYSDCLCKPGYLKSAVAELCEACPASSFTDVPNRLTSCDSCGTNFAQLKNLNSRSQCRCLAGYYFSGYDIDTDATTVAQEDDPYSVIYELGDDYLNNLEANIFTCETCPDNLFCPGYSTYTASESNFTSIPYLNYSSYDFIWQSANDTYSAITPTPDYELTITVYVHSPPSACGSGATVPTSSAAASRVSSSCMCLAGFSGSGQDCVECTAGTYKSFAANQDCTDRCITGATTAGGSVDQRQCKCTSGRYLSGPSTLSVADCNSLYTGSAKVNNPTGAIGYLSDFTCAVCPTYAECLGGFVDGVDETDYENIFLDDHMMPRAYAGYYSTWLCGRAGVESCFVSEACLGANMTTGENMCIEGMNGILCDSCDAGYFRYNVNSVCIQCPNVGVTAGIALVCVSLSIMFIIKFASSIQKASKFRRLRAALIVRAWLCFSTVLTIFNEFEVLVLPLPSSVESYSTVIFSILTFDFLSLIPLDCLIRSETQTSTTTFSVLQTKQILYFALPFFICLAIVVLVFIFIAIRSVSKFIAQNHLRNQMKQIKDPKFFMVRRAIHRSAAERVQLIFGIVRTANVLPAAESSSIMIKDFRGLFASAIFIAHSFACRHLFKMTYCVVVFEELHLRYALDIICSDSEYSSWRIIGYATATGAIFAVPVYFIYLLKSLGSNRSTTELLPSVGVFMIGLKSRYYLKFCSGMIVRGLIAFLLSFNLSDFPDLRVILLSFLVLINIFQSFFIEHFDSRANNILNVLELWSNGSIFLIVLLSQFSYAFDVSESLQDTFSKANGIIIIAVIIRFVMAFCSAWVEDTMQKRDSVYFGSEPTIRNSGNGSFLTESLVRLGVWLRSKHPRFFFDQRTQDILFTFSDYQKALTKSMDIDDDLIDGVKEEEEEIPSAKKDTDKDDKGKKKANASFSHGADSTTGSTLAGSQTDSPRFRSMNSLDSLDSSGHLLNENAIDERNNNINSFVGSRIEDHVPIKISSDQESYLRHGIVQFQTEVLTYAVEQLQIAEMPTDFFEFTIRYAFAKYSTSTPSLRPRRLGRRTSMPLIADSSDDIWLLNECINVEHEIELRYTIQFPEWDPIKSPYRVNGPPFTALAKVASEIEAEVENRQGETLNVCESVEGPKINMATKLFELEDDEDLSTLGKRGAIDSRSTRRHTNDDEEEDGDDRAVSSTSSLFETFSDVPRHGIEILAMLNHSRAAAVRLLERMFNQNAYTHGLSIDQLYLMFIELQEMSPFEVLRAFLLFRREKQRKANSIVWKCKQDLDNLLKEKARLETDGGDELGDGGFEGGFMNGSNTNLLHAMEDAQNSDVTEVLSTLRQQLISNSANNKGISAPMFFRLLDTVNGMNEILHSYRATLFSVSHERDDFIQSLIRTRDAFVHALDNKLKSVSTYLADGENVDTLSQARAVLKEKLHIEKRHHEAVKLDQERTLMEQLKAARLLENHQEDPEIRRRLQDAARHTLKGENAQNVKMSKRLTDQELSQLSLKQYLSEKKKLQDNDIDEENIDDIIEEKKTDNDDAASIFSSTSHAFKKKLKNKPTDDNNSKNSQVTGNFFSKNPLLAVSQNNKNLSSLHLAAPPGTFTNRNLSSNNSENDMTSADPSVVGFNKLPLQSAISKNNNNNHSSGKLSAPPGLSGDRHEFSTVSTNIVNSQYTGKLIDKSNRLVEGQQSPATAISNHNRPASVYVDSSTIAFNSHALPPGIRGRLAPSTLAPVSTNQVVKNSTLNNNIPPINISRIDQKESSSNSNLHGNNKNNLSTGTKVEHQNSSASQLPPGLSRK